MKRIKRWAARINAWWHRGDSFTCATCGLVKPGLPTMYDREKTCWSCAIDRFEAEAAPPKDYWEEPPYEHLWEVPLAIAKDWGELLVRRRDIPLRGRLALQTRLQNLSMKKADLESGRPPSDPDLLVPGGTVQFSTSDVVPFNTTYNVCCQRFAREHGISPEHGLPAHLPEKCEGEHIGSIVTG